MRALLLPVREHPREIDVDDWRSMAALIGCELIQTIIIEDKIFLVCDETFCIDGARPNRKIDGVVYAGDLIIIGYDDEGNFAPLPEEAFEKYKTLFCKPEYLDGEFKITTSTRGNVVSIDQTFQSTTPFSDNHNKTLIKQILDIRACGRVNMLSLKEVQRLAYEMEYFNLVLFIEEHPQEYWHFIMTGEGLGNVEDVE